MTLPALRAPFPLSMQFDSATMVRAPRPVPEDEPPRQAKDRRPGAVRCRPGARERTGGEAGKGDPAGRPARAVLCDTDDRGRGARGPAVLPERQVVAGGAVPGDR